jgi:hypothetical protein
MRRYTLKPTTLRIETLDWGSCNYTERKVFDILTGLALGILSDGELTQKEATFLASWIEANSRNLPHKFIKNLLPIIRLAGDGKELSEDDLSCITKILESISFGDAPRSLVEQSPTIGIPCALIFDEIDFSQIKFHEVEFIFSGNFSNCSKKELMERTVGRGAIAKSANPTKQTDFVVVGSKGSGQWAYSGLGRKVEHALKLKEESCKLLIIREEVFIQALERNDSDHIIPFST